MGFGLRVFRGFGGLGVGGLRVLRFWGGRLTIFSNRLLDVAFDSYSGIASHVKPEIERRVGPSEGRFPIIKPPVNQGFMPGVHIWTYSSSLSKMDRAFSGFGVIMVRYVDGLLMCTLIHLLVLEPLPFRTTGKGIFVGSSVPAIFFKTGTESGMARNMW